MVPQVKTLLAVLLLAAIATALALYLPAAKKMAALSLALDLVPFAGALAAAVITAARLRRTNIERMPLLLATYGCFAGALVGALGVAHLVAVMAKAMNETSFVYDFRLYALIQLGLALVACGFIAAMLAPRLVMGQRSVWWMSLVIWSMVLMINLPLIPLQGFAILFSVLAALAVLALYGMRHLLHLKLAVPDPER